MPPDPGRGPSPVRVVTLHPSYPIRTARLLLRPLTLADRPALLSYRGDPEVCRYLPFEPMTAAVLTTRLLTDLSATTVTAEGEALTLGAEIAETGQLAGDVVLFYRSKQYRGGEIGWVFHPTARGHGYATEASAAMLRLAFDGLGLHRVMARIDARNLPSARLAERLGMRQEAHLVENELFKGQWSDELVYAMLDREWPSSRAAAC